MKTPLLLCLAFLSLSAPLFSQETTKGDLITQISKEACVELSKTGDLSKKTPDDLKITLGLAVVKILVQHQTELSAFGINVSTPQSLEGVASDVGIQLAVNCPSFLSLLTGNKDAIKELMDDKNAASRGTLSGKLLNVVDGDFTYLQIEDSKGKVEKLWWLEFFDGSNKLLSNPQGQLNKPIKVNYVDKEVFNSTLKDYVKIKVITGIE